MPTIDVLLPVKNSVSYLGESIESVIAQTFKDWRLLVLDHGSSDGSLELAHQYADRNPRIIVYSNPYANGLGGLLNWGIDIADSRFIFRQDGDDISLPTRFQKTIDAFSDNAGVAAIGGQAEVINYQGEHLGYIRRPLSPEAIAASSFFSNPMLHPTMAFDRLLMHKINARYGDDFLGVLSPYLSINVNHLAEDYFLCGQLSLLSRCLNLGEILIRYRHHKDSESAKRRVDQTRCALDISRFLALSLATMKNSFDFDPAPFCTHAEYIFDFGKSDYSDEFERMAVTLKRGLGTSTELECELAFRRVFAKRSMFFMIPRYVTYGSKYGWKADEYRPVRNWLARSFNTKYTMPVTGGIAPWRGGRIRKSPL